MQCLLTFLDSGSGTVISIKYPSTLQIIFVHIFSQEYENFPFSYNPRGLSIDVNLGRRSDISGWPALYLSFHSWPKICDRVIPSAPFNADSPQPLSPAQKLFLPNVQHDLLIHFTYFWRSAFRQNRSSLTEFFWSNRLACFGCFRDILSFCQAVSAISPFWHTVCVLDIIVLSWCGIWHYSILLVAKKFGIFERILKFNWYIQVEISDDTFTNSLNSKISTEWMIFIFLKWTIPIMWSSIPNRCRSGL